LDAVGCHGQTVRHLPNPVEVDGRPVSATVQLGSGPVIANLLEVTTVTDFRSADMALGGQGAPLVPYVDWVLFSEEARVVGALNLGGIANVTILRGTDRHQAIAFDTGPGNMVVDALVQRFFGRPFDRDGEIAASGTLNRALLESLQSHRYFARKPPKSTGRELFGDDYAARLVAHPKSQGLAPQDLVATATALTAESVADSLRSLGVQRLFVSGGGVHNRHLMRLLAEAVQGVEIATSAERGVDPDGKEAFAFAVLAHEALNGVPTGLPGVTGASRTVIQGSISLSV
jgi:anhydro-N-acetylmuramic acid kinase